MHRICCLPVFILYQLHLMRNLYDSICSYQNQINDALIIFSLAYVDLIEWNSQIPNRITSTSCNRIICFSLVIYTVWCMYVCFEPIYKIWLFFQFALFFSCAFHIFLRSFCCFKQQSKNMISNFRSIFVSVQFIC